MPDRTLGSAKLRLWPWSTKATILLITAWSLPPESTVTAMICAATFCAASATGSVGLAAASGSKVVRLMPAGMPRAKLTADCAVARVAAGCDSMYCSSTVVSGLTEVEPAGALRTMVLARPVSMLIPPVAMIEPCAVVVKL